MNQIFSLIEKNNEQLKNDKNKIIILLLSKINELDQKLKIYELEYPNLYTVCGINPPKKSIIKQKIKTK